MEVTFCSSFSGTWQNVTFDPTHQHFILSNQNEYYLWAEGSTSTPKLFYKDDDPIGQPILAKVSIDLRLIAVQTNLKTIFVVDIFSKKKWSLSIKSSNDNKILPDGIIWSDHGGNSQDLIIVTTTGLELYKISTRRNQCKLSRTVSQTSTAFWYEPNHRFILLACENKQQSSVQMFLSRARFSSIKPELSPKTTLTMNGYFLRTDPNEFPRLELPPPEKCPSFDLSISTDQSPFENFFLVTIHRRLFGVTLVGWREGEGEGVGGNRYSDALLLHRLSKTSAIQTHLLCGLPPSPEGMSASTISLSVLDNLLICHSLLSNLSVIYDLRIVTGKITIDNSVTLDRIDPIIPPFELTLPITPMPVSPSLDTPPPPPTLTPTPTPTPTPPSLYSPSFQFFFPDLLYDSSTHSLHRFRLHLPHLTDRIPNPRCSLLFLSQRGLPFQAPKPAYFQKITDETRSAALGHEAKRLMLAIVSSALERRLPLPWLETIFDILNFSYVNEQFRQDCIQSLPPPSNSSPSSPISGRAGGGSVEQNRRVSYLPQSYASSPSPTSSSTTSSSSSLKPSRHRSMLSFLPFGSNTTSNTTSPSPFPSNHQWSKFDGPIEDMERKTNQEWGSIPAPLEPSYASSHLTVPSINSLRSHLFGETDSTPFPPSLSLAAGIPTPTPTPTPTHTHTTTPPPTPTRRKSGTPSQSSSSSSTTTTSTSSIARKSLSSQSYHSLPLIPLSTRRDCEGSLILSQSELLFYVWVPLVWQCTLKKLGPQGTGSSPPPLPLSHFSPSSSSSSSSPLSSPLSSPSPPQIDFSYFVLALCCYLSSLRGGGVTVHPSLSLLLLSLLAANHEYSHISRLLQFQFFPDSTEVGLLGLELSDTLQAQLSQWSLNPPSQHHSQHTHSTSTSPSSQSSPIASLTERNTPQFTEKVRELTDNFMGFDCVSPSLSLPPSPSISPPTPPPIPTPPPTHLPLPPLHQSPPTLSMQISYRESLRSIQQVSLDMLWRLQERASVVRWLLSKAHVLPAITLCPKKKNKFREGLSPASVPGLEFYQAAVSAIQQQTLVFEAKQSTREDGERGGKEKDEGEGEEDQLDLSGGWEGDDEGERKQGDDGNGVGRESLVQLERERTVSVEDHNESESMKDSQIQLLYSVFRFLQEWDKGSFSDVTGKSKISQHSKFPSSLLGDPRSFVLADEFGFRFDT